MQMVPGIQYHSLTYLAIVKRSLSGKTNEMMWMHPLSASVITTASIHIDQTDPLGCSNMFVFFVNIIVTTNK